MATKFLELGDGIFVEIAAPEELREEMHTSTAERVSTTMRSVASMVKDVVRPLADSFTNLYEALDVPIAVDAAEVELGVSFSAEGQIFVAKTKGEGTLKLKVVFKTVPNSQSATAKTKDAANENES
jgi:hypothetical protein